MSEDHPKSGEEPPEESDERESESPAVDGSDEPNQEPREAAESDEPETEAPDAEKSEGPEPDSPDAEESDATADEQEHLAAEWDSWVWGESGEIDDESVTEAYDDLLARIGEDTAAERADETDDATGGMVDRALGALGGGTETDDAPRIGFDDLLERVKAREERRGRTDDAATERHDLEAISEARDARSILLIGSLGSAADDETCLSAFDVVEPADQRVLLVTLERQRPSRLELFLDRYGADETAAIAHIGRFEQSPAPEGVVRTAQVGDPSDLADLGINISMIIADWADENERITVCLHSLTPMLRAVSNERVFRFLHLLLGRLEEADARLHVHVDADAHEWGVLGLYRDLFDVTFEVTEDGLQAIS